MTSIVCKYYNADKTKELEMNRVFYVIFKQDPNDTEPAKPKDNNGKSCEKPSCSFEFGKTSQIIVSTDAKGNLISNDFTMSVTSKNCTSEDLAKYKSS